MIPTRAFIFSYSIRPFLFFHRNETIMLSIVMLKLWKSRGGYMIQQSVHVLSLFDFSMTTVRWSLTSFLHHPWNDNFTPFCGRLLCKFFDINTSWCCLCLCQEGVSWNRLCCRPTTEEESVVYPILTLHSPQSPSPNFSLNPIESLWG